MSLLTRNEPSQGSFVRVFLLCCSFSHKNSQMCLLTRNEPSQGSFRFPPPAGCFFCGRPARPAMLPVEAKQPIPWYQPHTGTSEIPKSLSMSLVVTPPHRGGACIASACIAFRDWRAPPKPVKICQRTLAQLLYLVISPFCIRSRGLVLNLEVGPTVCISLRSARCNNIHTHTHTHMSSHSAKLARCNHNV